MNTITLVVDPTVRSYVRDLIALLARLREIVPRPVELDEVIDRGAAAFVDLGLKGVPTGRADELRVILDPSRRHFELVAALRALDRVGEHFRHDVSPSVVGTATIERVGEGG